MLAATRASIEHVAGRSRSDLDREPTLRDVVVRQLEILGGAASHVSDATRLGEPWGTDPETRQPRTSKLQFNRLQLLRHRPTSYRRRMAVHRFHISRTGTPSARLPTGSRK